jgi:hypothetical protein
VDQPILWQNAASSEFVVGSGLDDLERRHPDSGKVTRFHFRVLLKNLIVRHAVDTRHGCVRTCPADQRYQ